MKNSEKIALVIAIAYCILHLSIILQIIPYSIVWGGKIKSDVEMYVLEGIALVIMSFLGIAISMKNRIIKPIFTHKTLKRIVFVFAVFFMLNTVGNLLAETAIEKYQAILTLYLAIALFKSSKQIES